MTILPEVRASVVAAAERRARPARRWWRRPIRIGALGCGAVLATGSALAATDVWNPVLGRPELHDTPASVSDSPVPPSTVATLGVLRRPQTSADRAPAALALLRHAGVESAGVRPASVRLITLSDGRRVVIYSQQKTVNPSTGATEMTEPVCVLFPGGGTCATLDTIGARGMLMTAGPRILGVVPDGVATVVLEYPGGDTRNATVSDNIYTLDDAPLVARNSPPGSGLPPMTVGERPSSIHWLNEHGTIVGPPTR
jgi:hypothetical protein